MHPALFEALILAAMGISGVATALLLGFRKAVPLAVVAFASTVVVRILTAFASWSLGTPEWTLEAWLSVSAVATVIAVARHWSVWRDALGAVGIFGGLSAVALATKYLFDIGERHHSDSASVLAISILVIQGDEADVEPLAGHIKRGIAYPLMVALGPEGRILGAFTPLLFLITLLAIAWFAYRSLRGRVQASHMVIAASAVAVFSLSVPMFRVAMFYLNAHTLMGFGLLLMVGGYLMARGERELGRQAASLIALGGVISATARAEGIVLVLIVLAAVAGARWRMTSVERWWLFTVVGLIGLSFAWWFIALDIGVAGDFGLSNELLPVIALVGASLVALPLVDPLRPWFLAFVAAVIFGWLGWFSWSIGSPFAVAISQWPNLGLGAGGWATAAHLFIGSAILLGFTGRSSDYRALLILSVVIIGGIIFGKAFGGGGFGREGFFDSVNRMWLHVMPVVLLTSLIGYTELLSQAAGRKVRGGKHSLTTPASEKVSQ